ncbi:MAG: LysM peptidoglycan-binding domain-containing protein [Chloroflexales bacterium]|nr:LysM peptidoglycan-binding domain-containing protein [Chloroflexales bacterium]
MSATIHILTGPLGLIVSLLLIGLLVMSEFLRVSGNQNAQSIIRQLQVAILSLLVVFALTVGVRLSIALNDELHLISTFSPSLATTTPLPDIDMLTYFPLVIDNVTDDTSVVSSVPPNRVTAQQTPVVPSGVTFFPLVTTGVTQEPDIVVIVYVVHEGDQLTNLASRFNTTIEAIVALNPQIDTSTNDLVDGDVIRIPALQLQTTQEAGQ